MPYAAACTRLTRAAALLSAAGLVACGTAPPAPAPASPPAAAAPAPAAVPVAPAPAPPSSALSARFPEPAVSYRTPAFQFGRSTPTSSAELQRLLQGLARDHASVVRTVKLGEAQTGNAYEALLFSRSAQATPESLRSSGRATVVLFGPQRPEAPAGSEALLVVAQELAQGRLQRLLDQVNVIVWPQVPPAEGAGMVGDHLQLKTPYAQALARLVREYQPVVVAEVSEYLPSPTFSLRFAAVERHDALLHYAATGNMAPFVTKAAEEWFRQPLTTALRQQGLSTEWHYSIAADAVERRLSMGSPRPDSSRNVQGLRHAVSLVIESRGDPAGGRLHFKRRVHTLVTGLGSVLQSAADRGTDLLKLRQYVEAEVASQACKGSVVVEAELTPSEHTLQALDADTGVEKSFTVSWDSALALRELRTRPRPCGYWLDASQTEAVARLRLLGVRVEQVLSKGVVQGDSYVEAAAPPSREVKTVAALLDLPPGSYYVPLSQPLAHLAVAALEPDTAYSYRAGGLVTDLDKSARVMSWPGVKLAVMP
jgi:hypothetical protein